MASNRNEEIKSQLENINVVCLTKKDALEMVGKRHVFVWTNVSSVGHECCFEAIDDTHPPKKDIVAVLANGTEYGVWASKDASDEIINHICQLARDLASTLVCEEPEHVEEHEHVEEAEQVVIEEPVAKLEEPVIKLEEPVKEKVESLVVTHSSMHCFMGCRQKYDYRYNQNIIPTDRPDALTFGSAVHAGLEMWFKTGSADAAVEVAGSYEGLDDGNRVKAREMVRKYTEVYTDEPFNVVEIEHTFLQKARHPKSNKLSKRISYTGRIDGLIEKDGELWILEHKTASVADDAYFECKDFDDQIALYAIAMSDELGKPVVGALYDVLIKPRLVMSKGESDEEYAARVAASKTGKIKRKEAETVEGFTDRVSNAITEFNYTRRWIRFDPVDLIRKKAAFWAISHDIANGEIYQNTCACNSGYGACEYRHLCKARGDLSKCSEYYTTRAPHEELVDKDSAE